MADWSEILAGAVAGGSLGTVGTAIASALRARSKREGDAATADAKVGVALVVRDQTIADRLLTRIGDLETRCDVLSDGITEARREAEECRQGRAECERRTEALEGRVVEAEDLVERMRDQIERVALRLNSTPPGSWALETEPERED